MRPVLKSARILKPIITGGFQQDGKYSPGYYQELSGDDLREVLVDQTWVGLRDGIAVIEAEESFLRAVRVRVHSRRRRDDRALQRPEQRPKYVQYIEVGENDLSNGVERDGVN